MLNSIIVPVAFFLCLYKIIELFVRRKERIKIIEKMSDNPNFKDLNLSFGSKFNHFWVLRTSLILIGLGAAMLASYYLTDSENHTIIQSGLFMSGGGIGALISFLIEDARRRKDKEGEEDK